MKKLNCFCVLSFDAKSLEEKKEVKTGSCSVNWIAKVNII